VRIIRGSLKAKKIAYPKRTTMRPTTDFAKEGLFNVLESRFEGLTDQNLSLLDLCVGSGSISFEWLSRGAGIVVAVDNDMMAVKHVKETAKLYQVDEQIQVYCSDIQKFVARTNQTFHVIFVDLPYENAYHAELVTRIYDKQLLKKNGVLIVEHGKKTDLTQLPHYEMAKQYGNVFFSFFS